MAAAAIPALIKVGSMVGGSLLAKKLSAPTSQQSSAMSGTQGAQQMLGQAAPQLMGAGQQATATGVSGASTAANYYKSLLSGGRAGLTAATAPEAGAALDYYKGAEGKVQNTMRGGGRDMALAELDRQKTGQLAMLPAQARAGAAQGLVGASAPLLQSGTAQTEAGVNAGYGAAGAGTQLFNQATTSADRQSKAGSGIGGMIYDAISGWASGKGKWGFGGGGGSTWTPASEVG